MGFPDVATLVNAELAGKCQFTSFRKVPTQATTAGMWVDLSMGTGNPVANFYAAEPLVAATLLMRKGIYHGGAVSTLTKHLTELTALTVNVPTVPITLYLCDYLLYYPFIDMDSTDPQDLTNHIDNPDVPGLPRYTDGVGVKAFMVAVTPYIGGQQFQIRYTNQSGVHGRLSPICTSNTGTNIATLITGG